MRDFSGFIYLQKKILDNAIWQGSEPFDKRSAWVDLILRANYEDSEAMSRSGEVITVHRGQLLTSQTHLAERWKWSRPKVHRFLEHLKSAKMLNFEHLRWDRGATLVTILNYSVYQDPSVFVNAKRASNERKPCAERASSVTHLNKINKDNEINKKKGDDFWR